MHIANIIKNFEHPDKVEQLGPNTKRELVTIGNVTFSRMTTLPNPSARKMCQHEMCPYPHTLIPLLGTIEVKTADGKTFMIKPGDVCYLEPQHQTVVVGDEPGVTIEIIPGVVDTSK